MNVTRLCGSQCPAYGWLALRLRCCGLPPQRWRVARRTTWRGLPPLYGQGGWLLGNAATNFTDYSSPSRRENTLPVTGGTDG